MALSIVTWNVNSIRARHDRVLAFLDRHDPDIVCLQETKVEDADFPVEAITEAGYHAVIHGQRTYNGVAILSKQPATNVVMGLPGEPEDEQARLIAADIGGLRIVDVYVPNGRTVTDDDKYPYKLRWLNRLESFLADEIGAGKSVVLCGDYNIAPTDDDVAKPERWANSVLCHHKVRDAFGRLVAMGLNDAVRARIPEVPGPYSWWDYRRLAFPKGDGLRIDHILVTADVLARTTGAFVDRDERKGKQPSDHAPVFVQLD
ncbi:MAG: exodeoxyribonuclease III [Rhodothermales bacterium]|nr:exodeoxyribonuclease III [Rhodothermales bacterium]MBO6779198.1 exodeoxyribonuclease III [Rhodothermales bacterium]